MKRTLVLLVLLVQLAQLEAQTPFNFDWHGFVNPHYYADSRSVVGGREDMMLFYPKPILRDSLGRDINDGWQADMLAITARLNLRVSGPDMLGAKTSAFIEGDFTGSTNATINDLRLRHAYITMDWYDNQGEFRSLKHTLKVGQYWYPMVIHEIMPMTNPLNMGAPFHCYARQPQVRYEFISHGFEVVAAACWQLDNMSQGLLNGLPTSSTQFARHSLVPELNAQLRYLTEHLFVGAAVNLKTIQPMVNTTGLALEPNPHTSFTWSLFGRYRFGGVTVKAQALLNNSLYEGCSMGGYLLRTVDGVPYQYAARDWHFDTYWLDLERNRGHWRPGLFLGYGRNRDFGTPLSIGAGTTTDYALGRGFDIEYLWRLQPRLTYKTLTGLDFTAEVEYTCAAYGRETVVGPDRLYLHDPDGIVGNLRLSLSMVYSF
ncbi:MAG: hypothetical protein IJ524_02485 [Bacteroidales bacterium]|nr:hypothetical protein [Bacteroidales bacterium]